MSTQSSLGEQTAGAAEQIIAHAQHTRYQHETFVDLATGTYDFDCSGFVSFILDEIAHEQYEEIPKESDRDRPRAFKYYEFLHFLVAEAIDGWTSIERLADCQRGDVIAWRFAELVPGRDTGHVCIVAAAPQPIDDVIWSVKVDDSSAIPHFEDTRGLGGSSPETGVGSGVINFRLDPNGHPIAYQFNPDDGFRMHPIAIGRLELFDD